MSSLLLGHVELCAQAAALLGSCLEKQHRKLSHAAPLAADQLRRLETNLYAVALQAWQQNNKQVWVRHILSDTEDVGGSFILKINNNQNLRSKMNFDVLFCIFL